MQTIHRYSVKKSASSKHSALFQDGKPLNLKIEGEVLEGQFETKEGNILIWLTDDSPFEEGLHVYLIDKHHNIIDSLEAGSIFSTGILKFIKTTPNSINFTFFLNESSYELIIEGKSTFRILLPTGWKYKKFLKSHQLTIHETHQEKNHA